MINWLRNIFKPKQIKLIVGYEHPYGAWWAVCRGDKLIDCHDDSHFIHTLTGAFYEGLAAVSRRYGKDTVVSLEIRE